MFDIYTPNMAEIFAVPQIVLVLVIALIVFGPKRMPELGKSIGSALRELNKAKNDMMKTFTLDHDADHEPYKHNDYTPNTYDSSHYSYNPTPETPDLSDYTIAGLPPVETTGVEGTVARGSNGHNGYDPAASADYTIASYTPAAGAGVSSGASVADTHTGSPDADAPADGPHKGDQNV